MHSASQIEHQAYIGLGANLNNPLAQLRSALQHLDRSPHIQLIQCSHFYRSKPVGPADQPDYINAVAELNTALSPLALLHACQSIENDHGRTRTGARWGPRTLDIDMLLYRDQRETHARQAGEWLSLKSEELDLPHPELRNRSFVVLPLLEIAPELKLEPTVPLASLAGKLSDEILVKLPA